MNIKKAYFANNLKGYLGNQTRQKRAKNDKKLYLTVIVCTKCVQIEMQVDYYLTDADAVSHGWDHFSCVSKLFENHSGNSENE